MKKHVRWGREFILTLPPAGTQYSFTHLRERISWSSKGTFYYCKQNKFICHKGNQTRGHYKNNLQKQSGCEKISMKSNKMEKMKSNRFSLLPRAMVSSSSFVSLFFFFLVGRYSSCSSQHLPLSDPSFKFTANQHHLSKWHLNIRTWPKRSLSLVLPILSTRSFLFHYPSEYC